MLRPFQVAQQNALEQAIIFYIILRSKTGKKFCINHNIDVSIAAAVLQLAFKVYVFILKTTY